MPCCAVPCYAVRFCVLRRCRYDFASSPVVSAVLYYTTLYIMYFTVLCCAVYWRQQSISDCCTDDSFCECQLGEERVRPAEQSPLPVPLTFPLLFLVPLPYQLLHYNYPSPHLTSYKCLYKYTHDKK